MFTGSTSEKINLPSLLPIPFGGITSRPLAKMPGLKQVLFVMDKDAVFEEHTSSHAAIVQVVSGRIDFDLEGVTHNLVTGDWLAMPAKAPHALRALEPSTFTLTLATEGTPHASAAGSAGL